MPAAQGCIFRSASATRQLQNTMNSYRETLEQLRTAFPYPVSDHEHHARFVQAILQAVDKVESLKSQLPILGEPRAIDFAQAVHCRLQEAPLNVETVCHELVDHLSGLFLYGHPRTQINVQPPSCIPGILGTLLPAICNPNLCSEASGRGAALAEAEVISMTAELLGCDPQQASGAFTFGGSGTLLYALRLGIGKALPQALHTGLTGQPPVVVCSDQAHYAVSTAAAWLGIGLDNVVVIPTAPNNEIRTCLLESELRRLLRDGRHIAAIVATMGTTDAFGLDNLQQIRELRDQLAHEFCLDYLPHLHADAVIGWAWSVFRDYDFTTNLQQFPEQTLRLMESTIRRIQHLPLADSIGVDYHKTGFAPYISSAFICTSAEDLRLITRDPAATPYLFQSGHYNPGRFTLETSRSGSGPMAALGALRMFGRAGLRCLLGHLVTMAQLLRNQLTDHSAVSVMNPENFGTVTLFRVYPPGVDSRVMPLLEQSRADHAAQLHSHNEYNRRLYHLLHTEALQGDGVVLSMTDRFRVTDYGEPVVALKSCIMSPFTETQHVDAVLESIERARLQLP